MARQEGSVAPKERINIRYKSETGGAEEEVELPLKLFMMGDYTLREDDTMIEDRKPININKQNFNDVMKSQALSLDINVKDCLTDDQPENVEDPKELSMSLKFETLKDFNPEQIANSVPELKKILELRQSLVALKGPLGNIPSFRKGIQEILGDEDKRAKLMDEILADSSNK